MISRENLNEGVCFQRGLALMPFDTKSTQAPVVQKRDGRGERRERK